MTNKRTSQPSALRKSSWQFGSEFLGGILTGVLLGYFADKIFNLFPWGIIVGISLGVLTGFWNIYRLYRSIISSNFLDKKKFL